MDTDASGRKMKQNSMQIISIQTPESQNTYLKVGRVPVGYLVQFLYSEQGQVGIFFIFWWNLLYLKLYLWPLVLSVGITKKCLALPILYPPIRCTIYIDKIPHESLLFQVEQSHVSALPHRRDAPAPLSPQLLVGLSSMSMSLVFWGMQAWTLHSRCGLTTVE